MAMTPVVGAAELMILFLFGGGAGLPMGVPPTELDELALKIAPEKTLYYSTWAGMAAPDAGSTNETEKILAEPEIQHFFAEIDKQLTRGLRKMAAGNRDPKARLLAEAGPVLAKTLLMRPAAIFLNDFNPRPHGAEIEAGLIVNCGDKVAEVRTVIQRLQKELVGDMAKEVEIADNPFYRIKVDESVPLFTWGTRGNYLIVGIGDGAVEGIFERAATPPPAWLAAARKQVRVERTSTLSYINVAEIIDRGISLSGSPEARRMVDAVGAANVTALISATGLDQNGFVNRTLLEIDGEAQGIFALADAEPLTRENLSIIPKDAAVAAALRLDADQVLTTALKIMGEVEPRAAEKAAIGLENVETMLGLNLRGDLLKALGDTWCVYADPSAGGFITGWTATAEIRDREKLLATHNQLVGLARGAFIGRDAEDAPQIKTMAFGEHEIHYLLVPGDDMPFSPAWCMTDKHLVVGAFPQTVKAFLGRGDDFQSLADAPEVADLFGEDSSHPLSVVYIDTKQFFDPLYSFAQVMAQAAIGEIREQGIDIDLAALPSAGAIRKHLRPSIAATRRTDAGIEATSWQTLPAGSIGATAPLLLGLGLPAVQSARGAARRSASMNNLRQIGIAMHNYNDVYGSLPAAYSIDQDGKPLLSWRVHILPYIEHQALYRQFRLDEPWDSEHNKQLIPLMPDFYRSPGGAAEAGKTNYLAIRSDSSMIMAPADSERGKPRPAGTKFNQVVDGLSNTAIIVEAGNQSAVVWTKPDDFEPPANNPAGGLFGLRKGGFLAAFGDGHVRVLGFGIDQQTLRNIFSINDGNEVRLD